MGNIDGLIQPASYSNGDTKYENIKPVSARLFPYDFSRPSFDIDAALISLLGIAGKERWGDFGGADGSFLRLVQAHAHEGELIVVELNPIGDELKEALNEEELRKCLGSTAFNATTAAVILRLLYPERMGLGNDPSDDPIANLSKQVVSSPITMIKGDVRDMHFLNDNSIDIATLKLMMYEVPEEDRPRVYKEVDRILSEHGKAAFSTSGLNNRQHKRTWELLSAHYMREYLGVEVTAPEPMNHNYTTEIMEEELAEIGIFKHIHIFKYHGAIDVKDDFVIEAGVNSVVSLWDQFEGVTDEKTFKAVLDKELRPFIVKMARKKGYVERVERAIAIASNDELDARRLKHQAEKLHLEYKQVA